MHTHREFEILLAEEKTFCEQMSMLIQQFRIKEQRASRYKRDVNMLPLFDSGVVTSGIKIFAEPEEEPTAAIPYFLFVRERLLYQIVKE